ncbi:MAG: chromate efflux transporter [Brachymonas sp.]|nr:chromate efflux transporter [Brachymonas sp.]
MQMTTPDHNTPHKHATPQADAHDRHPWQIFRVFLKLGLSAFGGPVAHLGYFRNEFVQRRQWLSEHSYADLVALCQFLPGPASSQVGMALGLSRGGYLGAFAAWVGFTLPSAFLLMVFAYGMGSFGQWVPAGVLHGLKIVAVAVVAQAVWGMAKRLCAGVLRTAIMLLVAGAVLLWSSAWVQLLALVVCGAAGMLLFKPDASAAQGSSLPVQISRRAGMVWLALFLVLLLGLPVLMQVLPNSRVAQVEAFYRAGALVFGGGHVVLPLLQASVVPPGWLSNDVFMAGYGAAQAVPGPLFTFAAFLGAAMPPDALPRWANGFLLLLAIMAPSFLLIAGAMPFWEALRSNARMRAALVGINAGVVGILLAALYHPVWTSAIYRPTDFLLAALAFVVLMFARLPSWLVVLATGLGGWLLAMW